LERRLAQQPRSQDQFRLSAHARRLGHARSDRGMPVRPIAIILLAAASAACGPSVSVDCTANALEEQISPDGRYVATAFHRECGTEAVLSTALGIREARAAFDPARQPTLLAIEGHHELPFEWSSEQS